MCVCSNFTGLFGSLQFRWPSDSKRKPKPETSGNFDSVASSNRTRAAAGLSKKSRGGDGEGGHHDHDDEPELGNDWAGPGSELGGLVYSTFTVSAGV